MRVPIVLLAISMASSGCKVSLPDFVGGDGGGPDAFVDPCPDSYSVGGTVDGLWSPAAVGLSLDPGAAPELLTVDANGAFSFHTCFQDHASFAVSVDTQPTQHACTVFNGNGVIDGMDVGNVTVRCEGPVAVDVAISAPLTFDFDAIATRQTLPVSLVSQAVRVAVDAPTADSIRVAGVLVGTGVESPPTWLVPGHNTIPIAITAGTFSRMYELDLDRGAMEIASVTMWKAIEPDTNDMFSASIDVCGDTMAIGVPGEDSDRLGWNGGALPENESAQNSGLVYLYRKVASPNAYHWAYEGYLKAPNTDPNDGFGWSVAVGDGFVAVGAPAEAGASRSIGGDETDNSASGAGAVYVFRREGSAWVEEAYIKASNADGGDSFGKNIAVSGSVLVVGAPNEAGGAVGVGGNEFDNSAPGAGAAYVYRRDGTTWSKEAYLKASDHGVASGVPDYFGTTVAISGNTVAVGSWREDSGARGVNGDPTDNSTEDAGAVWVFRYSNNTWHEEAYLKASNTDALDDFGYSLAADGDLIVVGARAEDSFATGVNGVETDNSSNSSGAAYVFHHDPSGWTQEAYLKASNTDAGDEFGWQVDVVGDLVVVGSDAEASSALGVGGDQGNDLMPGSGASYVFLRGESGYTQVAYLKSLNTDVDDVFGATSALSYDTLVAGAVQEDSSTTGTDNNLPESGAAYLFR